MVSSKRLTVFIVSPGALQTGPEACPGGSVEAEKG